ncbi:MAG: Xaa-Pro peptidase family protein [Pseudomonadota bacterium]
MDAALQQDRDAPPRGFAPAEYAARLFRAQAMMVEAGLEALLLTTEPEIRWFTGFLTRFWESPTRPWFVIVPAAGQPVAVIPAIGAPLMARHFAGEIRSWDAPFPPDDGITLLASTLLEKTAAGARIGLPSGHETHLRLPLDALERLRASLAEAPGSRWLTGDGGVMRRLRMVKSPAEIAKIATACAIAGRAFARLGEVAAPGVGLDAVFRGFQALAFAEGADWIPYLAGGAGPSGYADVISPADARPLAAGDVLMLDTGLVHDGYFCDFDRNHAIAHAGPALDAAHRRLLEAVGAGAAAARPGETAAGLFRAMAQVLGLDGPEGAGRLGHGLGMQLTEWPSLAPWDDTVLEAGMVLTLEPYLETAPGHLMVHEECIVIRDDGPVFLTQRSTGALPVLSPCAYRGAAV